MSNSGRFSVQPNSINTSEKNKSLFIQLHSCTSDAELARMFKISRKLVKSEASRLCLPAKDPELLKSWKRETAASNSRKGKSRKIKISKEEKQQRKNYFDLAHWKGSLLSFIDCPEQLKLLKRKKLFNPSSNVDGVVRDHEYSRMTGFNAGVFPEILRHPANMRLIGYRENLDKARTYVDSITLQQLFDKIRNYRKNWHEQEECMEAISKYENSIHWAKQGYEVVNTKLYSEKHDLELKSEHASAYDLPAMVEDGKIIVIKPNTTCVVPTGIRISLPVGWGACVRPRSGLAAKHQVVAILGTIDNDFRGPIGVILANFGDKDFEIKDGDRVAQLVLEKIYRANLIQVDTIEELGDTARGENGYGSSGIGK